MTSEPILAAFDAQTRMDPSSVLVASPSASATRGEVATLSRAVALSLDALALPPGASVLLAASNGAGFLAALLGCRRARLVPVLCDRTAPAAERARIVASLSLAAVIDVADAFPRAAADVAVERTGAAPRAIDGAGYVKLTSGSAGAPSAVAIAPEALAADDEQLARTMGLAASDRFLAAVSWSHSYGLSSLVLPALVRGSLLIVPDDGGPWAPLDAARRFEATVFPTVPAHVRSLAELGAPGAFPRSLRTVISAGAPLDAADALRFRETFGVPVHVFYGASECGGIAYDRAGDAAVRGTVGTAVTGVTIALEGDDAPERGRVAVRSAAAALPGGTFRTSDLAVWTPDGELRLLGRIDALINVGGKKVQPSEVEEVLRALPGVREAVVLGVRPERSDREIVRAVVAREPGRLTYGEVAAWCRARLAGHKVPRSIVLVDAIPRTERGKVDRAALVALVPERVAE